MGANPTPLTQRFADALQYALELHRAQTRKVSGTPYVAHLLAVTSIVLEHGADEDTAIAALLHDAVEDQGGATVREEILRRFGPRVAALVDGCTDTDASPKPPWQQRKQQHLLHAQSAPPEVRLILAADKLHNLCALNRDYRTHGESVWHSFRGGREGTLWYYRQMLASLAQLNHFPLLDEYAQALAEFETLLGATDGTAAAD